MPVNLYEFEGSNDINYSKMLRFFPLLVASCILFVQAIDDSKIMHSRRKRYVSFPEGSSFSCAGCMTVGQIGQPMSVPGTFTFGMNWGVAYELPNSTDTAAVLRKYKRRRKPVEQRRHRRELYQKIEAVMDKMGYNGRQCVLRTLCEATQRLVPHGANMIEEMFRILFTLPLSKVLPIEPPEHSVYDAAYRSGSMLHSCDAFACPLSLVDLAKGYYNTPAPTDPWAIYRSGFI